MIDYELLRTEVAHHPYPLLFVTISGAHLYGFPSANSDYDLRGVHMLPKKEVLGLLPKHETIECSDTRHGLEFDYVTHDVLKFFNMLLKRNGYVLEQLYSPLIVRTQPEHEELKQIARGCITKNHAHHYLGFAVTQFRFFQAESPPRVKPLLYTYRVLLTGLHLMKTGCVEASFEILNDARKLPFIPELIERKITGSENELLPEADREFHGKQYNRLRAELEEAGIGSHLPDAPRGRDDLNSLLLRLRQSD